MTILECIQYVDSIEPNAYNGEHKCRWLRECEGKVYTQLFLQQPVGFSVNRMSEIILYELAVPAPYNKIYPRYLQAMIHYANGEYDRYANSMQLFNEAWSELVRWFGQDYDISDRVRNRRVTVRITETVSGYFGDSPTLLTVPERCAFVAGRVVVKQPFAPPGENPNNYEITGNVWFGDPNSSVGRTFIDLSSRGSSGIKMLIGDVGGTDIGFTASTVSEGEAYLTGILCVPDEQRFWRSERQTEGMAGTPAYSQ